MKPTAEIRVLVVEDDPFFQRVLQKRLVAEGYQVMTANDGRDGLRAIVSFEPDLVISDWMMPEVDGLELCQSVKTGLREAAPYFILLTAKGEVDDKLLALETGADDYLVKPCDQAELMARVRAGLRIVLLTQELRRTVADLLETNRALDRTRGELSRISHSLEVCEQCKRIEAEGEWQSLDSFLTARGHAEFKPGMCPECLATRARGGAGQDDRAA